MSNLHSFIEHPHVQYVARVMVKMTDLITKKMVVGQHEGPLCFSSRVFKRGSEYNRLNFI